MSIIQGKLNSDEVKIKKNTAKDTRAIVSKIPKDEDQKEKMLEALQSCWKRDWKRLFYWENWET